MHVSLLLAGLVIGAVVRGRYRVLTGLAIAVGFGVYLSVDLGVNPAASILASAANVAVGAFGGSGLSGWWSRHRRTMTV